MSTEVLCRRLAAPDPAVALAAACNLSYRRRLVEGLAGNASCRTPQGFLCSPAGCCLGEVDPAALVALNHSWTPMGARIPTSEWRLHAAVYAARPEVGAVIHTHSSHALAVAVAGRDVEPLTPETDHFLGRVPCVPFARPGTEAVGAGVAAVIANGARAALLARHGAVAWGVDVRTAYHQAELLEGACRLMLTVDRLEA